MRIYIFKYEVGQLFGQCESRTMTRIYNLEDSKLNAVLVEKLGMTEDEHYLFMNNLKVVANEVWDNVQPLANFRRLYAQITAELEMMPRYQFDILDEETDKRVIQYRLMLPEKFVQSKFQNDMSEAMINYCIAKHYQQKGYAQGFQEYMTFYQANIIDVRSIACGSNTDHWQNSRTRRRPLF